MLHREKGKRPLCPTMAKLIADTLKKPLADEILFGRLQKGGRVRVQVKDDTLSLSYPA